MTCFRGSLRSGVSHKNLRMIGDDVLTRGCAFLIINLLCLFAMERTNGANPSKRLSSIQNLNTVFQKIKSTPTRSR